MLHMLLPRSAPATNATIIGISESKLGDSVLAPEIQIDDYKILWCDRNRHGGGVACYIRNDLSCNIVSVFPSEIKSVFFEILLPNSKPITVGTIYRSSSQSNFLEVVNENMNKIDSISNQIYILGHFNINLSLNDSYISSKKNMLNNKSIQSGIKSYYEFCTFFSKLPRGSYSTGYSWCRTVWPWSHFCTRKTSRIKWGTHKHIKFCSFRYYSADLFKETLTSINLPNYQHFNNATEAYDDFI